MKDNPFTGKSAGDINGITGKMEVPDDQFTYRRILGLLDLTSLNITDNEDTITTLVEKVNNFPFTFPDLPSVAAICIYPRFVPLVKKMLDAPGVRIASVGACFPSSQSYTSVKVEECRIAVAEGADEIDMVLSVGDLLSGNLEYVSSEIVSVKKAIGETHLKVILETGVMEKLSDIYLASMVAMEAGADFIKTSTGKEKLSATPEAAFVMCSAIRDYHAASGRKVGFKPAGGISTARDAALYYTIVESLLGRDWLVPELFRIGASRLANSILSTIEGRNVDLF